MKRFKMTLSSLSVNKNVLKVIRKIIEEKDELKIKVEKTGEGATIIDAGVEVHGGHSYLIGEFMSPHANRRDDEYGYDFNGRMCFRRRS